MDRAKYHAIIRSHGYKNSISGWGFYFPEYSCQEETYKDKQA